MAASMSYYRNWNDYYYQNNRYCGGGGGPYQQHCNQRYRCRGAVPPPFYHHQAPGPPDMELGEGLTGRLLDTHNLLFGTEDPSAVSSAYRPWEAPDGPIHVAGTTAHYAVAAGPPFDPSFHGAAPKLPPFSAFSPEPRGGTSPLPSFSTLPSPHARYPLVPAPVQAREVVHQQLLDERHIHVFESGPPQGLDAATSPGASPTTAATPSSKYENGVPESVPVRAPVKTPLRRVKRCPPVPESSSSEGDVSGTENSGQVSSVSSTGPAIDVPTSQTGGFRAPPDPSTDDPPEKPVKKKRKRCGDCVGCQRKDNCGDCAPCRNDKSHQICKMRRCDKLTEKRTPRGEKMDRRSSSMAPMMPFFPPADQPPPEIAPFPHMRERFPNAVWGSGGESNPQTQWPPGAFPSPHPQQFNQCPPVFNFNPPQTSPAPPPQYSYNGGHYPPSSSNDSYVPQGHFSPQAAVATFATNGSSNGFINQGNGIVGGASPHHHQYPPNSDFQSMFKSPLASPAVSVPEASPVTSGNAFSATQCYPGSQEAAGRVQVPQASPTVNQGSVQNRLKNMIMSRTPMAESPPEVHFSGSVSAVRSLEGSEEGEALKLAENFLAYRTAEPSPSSVVHEKGEQQQDFRLGRVRDMRSLQHKAAPNSSDSASLPPKGLMDDDSYPLFRSISMIEFPFLATNFLPDQSYSAGVPGQPLGCSSHFSEHSYSLNSCTSTQPLPKEYNYNNNGNMAIDKTSVCEQSEIKQEGLHQGQGYSVGLNAASENCYSQSTYAVNETSNYSICELRPAKFESRYHHETYRDCHPCHSNDLYINAAEGGTASRKIVNDTPSQQNTHAFERRPINEESETAAVNRILEEYRRKDKQLKENIDENCTQEPHVVTDDDNLFKEDNSLKASWGNFSVDVKVKDEHCVKPNPDDVGLHMDKEVLRNYLLKNELVLPKCSCVLPTEFREPGPVYTQLGCGRTLQELRKTMEERAECKGSAIRIEKVIYSGKEGKTDSGCPLAKWIIRRQGPEEKLLILAKRRPAHVCYASWIVIAIVAWDGVSIKEADDLYQLLVCKLNQFGSPTERRCGTNAERTCICQGDDQEFAGASFSFGCAWSVYYDMCKFARSKDARKFRLSDANEEKEVEGKLQQLATTLAPLYSRLVPESYRNQTFLENESLECRLGTNDGRPWTGITACLDFCAHSHKDNHNMNNGCTVVVSLTKHRNFEKVNDEQLHVLPLYVLDPVDQEVHVDTSTEKVSSGALEVLSCYHTKTRLRKTPLLSCNARNLLSRGLPVPLKVLGKGNVLKKRQGKATLKNGLNEDCVHPDKSHSNLDIVMSGAINSIERRDILTKFFNIKVKKKLFHNEKEASGARPCLSSDEFCNSRSQYFTHNTVLSSSKSNDVSNFNLTSESKGTLLNHSNEKNVTNFSESHRHLNNNFCSSEKLFPVYPWFSNLVARENIHKMNRSDGNTPAHLTCEQSSIQSTNTNVEGPNNHISSTSLFPDSTTVLDPDKQETFVKSSDNLDSFRDSAVGGVAIALSHGSVLFECAKHELHATTALKHPDRSDPKRISLVFYHHKKLYYRHHGYAELQQKIEKKKNDKAREMQSACQNSIDSSYSFSDVSGNAEVTFESSIDSGTKLNVLPDYINQEAALTGNRTLNKKTTKKAIKKLKTGTTPRTKKPCYAGSSALTQSETNFHSDMSDRTENYGNYSHIQRIPPPVSEEFQGMQQPGYAFYRHLHPYNNLQSPTPNMYSWHNQFYPSVPNLPLTRYLPPFNSWSSHRTRPSFTDK